LQGDPEKKRLTIVLSARLTGSFYLCDFRCLRIFRFILGHSSHLDAFMKLYSLPSVSIVLPVYNEAALLRDHINLLCEHLRSLEDRYQWEVIVVNDGSADDTASIADQLALENPQLFALHHPTNFGVGQALRFGIANTSGDYVVTMDIDLSYDVNHIEELVEHARQTGSKIVLASPYMPGGSIENVPLNRKVLSIVGNKFLKFFSQANSSTVTCMVRAYDGPFIRSLDLRGMGLDLMPETLYKAMILRAEISEIPGRLNWGPQLEYGENRTSSMRIFRHVNSTLMSGFVFRPMHFFILPGLIMSLFAAYVTFWMFGHYFEALFAARALDANAGREAAFAAAFLANPHTYVVGLASIVISVQLLSLGVLSLQNKRNYEDLYHLNSSKFHDLKLNVKEKKGSQSYD